MKKPARPFAARIPFDDKTRLIIAQTLDRREDLDLSWISQKILNRNHAYLFQYLFKRTPRTLDYADAVKLAHFLDIDTSAFSPDTQGTQKFSDPYRGAPLKRNESDAESVPVRGPSTHSPDAIQIDDGENIGRVPQHPFQKGMKGAFAFHAVGDTMTPRYRPGELVYAVTNQPPVHGQDCIVELRNGEGYLKQFDRRSDKDIFCKQLNPPQEWKHALADIKAVHAVVGRG